MAAPVEICCCLHLHRCMFVEHKPLLVADFKEVAQEEARRVTGQKGQAGSAGAAGVDGVPRRLESRRCVPGRENLSMCVCVCVWLV